MAGRQEVGMLITESCVNLGTNKTSLKNCARCRRVLRTSQWIKCSSRSGRRLDDLSGSQENMAFSDWQQKIPTLRWAVGGGLEFSGAFRLLRCSGHAVNVPTKALPLVRAQALSKKISLARRPCLKHIGSHGGNDPVSKLYSHRFDTL